MCNMQVKANNSLSVRDADGVIDTKHIRNRTVSFTLPADETYAANLKICGKEKTFNFSKIFEFS